MTDQAKLREALAELKAAIRKVERIIGKGVMVQTDLFGEEKKVRATRFPHDAALPAEWLTWCQNEGIGSAFMWSEFARFRDYWAAKSGKDAVKADWFATFRNWMRRAMEDRRNDPRRVGSADDYERRKAATQASRDAEAELAARGL